MLTFSIKHCLDCVHNMRTHICACLVGVPAHPRARAPVFSAPCTSCRMPLSGPHPAARVAPATPAAPTDPGPCPMSAGWAGWLPPHIPAGLPGSPHKPRHAPCDTAGLEKKTGDEKSKPRNFVENSKFRRNFVEISPKGALLILNDLCMLNSGHSNFRWSPATYTCARACRRESFSATAKPFDPKQKGEGEHTLCAESLPARSPRRTPSSTLTAGAGDRYEELP